MTHPPAKTRFAPSPTGHLHIGGARTALFNWLYARHLGGQFVLRIEDTDVERNVPGAEDKIRADLDWLGLTPDESPWVGGPDKPYRQSERLEQYTTYARKLLESGYAYYAFDTAEELTAMRDAAKRDKRQFKYRRTPSPFKGEGRGEGDPPTEADAAKARAEGRTVVIRMTAPTAAVTVHDHILGDVTIQPEEMEDFVIIKGNGWPTYHFAVVVDDEQMHITHVVRAQEHLMNTPKHIALQDALGFRRPVYAHVPIVMNMDGTKMSKRDRHKVVRAAYIKKFGRKAEDGQIEWTRDIATLQAWLEGEDSAIDEPRLTLVAQEIAVRPPEVEVNHFRRAGYLPEAVLNFIALLGWSPGEDREKMTLAEMTRLFTIERVGKTSARFDREKLLAFNTDACAAATPERLRAAFRDYARISDSPMTNLDDATLDRALAACKGFRTFADVDHKVGILFAPDDAVKYDPDAVRKVLAKNNAAGYAVLERLRPELESLDPWTSESLDALLKRFCETSALKLGDVAQPIRVAVTGRTISPTIAETLALLEKPKTLSRIEQCLHSRT